MDISGLQHERKIKEKHRFMWQHAWKKRAFRHFRFAQRPFTTLFFHAFLRYSALSLFFFTAESLSSWEKCGSIKTVHPCTVLMPSFVNKTRYYFVYPALHGGCFYSIQKSSPALWENLLFRCYLSRIFSQLMPCILRYCGLKDFRYVCAVILGWKSGNRITVGV